MNCDYKIQLNYKGVKREFIIPSLDTDMIKDNSDVLSHVKEEVHSVLEGKRNTNRYIKDILTYMKDVDNNVIETNPQIRDSVNNFINDRGIDFNALRNHTTLSVDSKFAPLIKELISPIPDEHAPSIHFALRDQIENESKMKEYTLQDLAIDNKDKIIAVKLPKFDKAFKATVTGEVTPIDLATGTIERLRVITSTGKAMDINPETDVEKASLINHDKLGTQVEDTTVKKGVQMLMGKHIYDRVSNKHKIILYVDSIPKSLDILKDDNVGKTIAHELVHFRIDRNINAAGYDSDKKQFTDKDLEILNQMKAYFLDKVVDTKTYRENSAIRDIINEFTSPKASTLEANEKHNLREFIAYASSEPLIKQAMNEIAVKGLPEKHNTLLDALTGWTAKSLAISTKNKSMLSSFHNVLVELFDVNKKPSDVYYDAKKDDLVRNESPELSNKVQADIPQNLVSGVTAFGTTQHATDDIKRKLGTDTPHSIDMIEAGLRTRTTRSVGEMQKYGVKVGDIIRHFGKSSNGTTKEVLARVTAIHPKGTPGFEGTWDKEGWTRDGLQYIGRFKDGAAAIEFEVLNKKIPSIQTTSVVKQTTQEPSGKYLPVGDYKKGGKKETFQIGKTGGGKEDRQGYKITFTDHPNFTGYVYKEGNHYSFTEAKTGSSINPAHGSPDTIKGVVEGVREVLNNVIDRSNRGDASQDNLLDLTGIQKESVTTPITKESELSPKPVVKKAQPPVEPVKQADTFYKPFTKIERVSDKSQTYNIPDAFESAYREMNITADVKGYQLSFEGHPGIDALLTKSKDSGKWMIVDKRTGFQIGNYQGDKFEDIVKNVISNLNTVVEAKQPVKALDLMGATKLGDSYNKSSRNTQKFIKSTDSTAHVRLLTDKLAQMYQLNFRMLNTEEIAAIYDTNRKYSQDRAFLNGNDIVINTDLASTADPLHELSHVVLAGIKTTDPDLYDAMVSAVQSHPRYNDIASNYPELEGNDLHEEVFATVFGERYRNVLKEREQLAWESDHKGFFARIIDNIKNFFKGLFNINSPIFDKMEPEEVANLSLDDIIGRFGDKMMEGHLKNYVDDYIKNTSKKSTDFKSKLKESNILNIECYA